MTARLVHSYTPRGACRELFDVRVGEVLLSGPAGTGKSRACLEKLHAVALANPGMRGLIVRKTAASLTSSALVTWRRDVIAEGLEAGVVSFYGGSAQEPPQYRYENGSVVAIGGMDKASKIMSTEFDVVYAQEATELTLEDWQSISTRLRNGVVSFQQLMADCNPSFASHWLKQRCDAGDTLMLYSKHSDNPRLYGDDGVLTGYGVDYLGRLEALSGVVRERLLEGRWSSAEGVVFEGWDPSVHVVDWFEPPESWSRFWGVDWGFTNPFVCQMWAEDPDGRLFLYREFYKTKRTVDQHAKDILEVVAPGGVWLEPKPVLVFADHDPEAQLVFSGIVGVSVVDASKAVGAGLQAVADRLVVAGDGLPRLFVMRGCLVERDQSLVEGFRPTCVEEELPGYVWEKGVRGSDVVKESPRKVDDHGCDALRYVVVGVGVRGGVRFRWVE